MSEQFQQYLSKKALLDKIQAEVAAMETDESFRRAVEYSQRLEALNKEYGLSLGEAIEILQSMIRPFNEQITTKPASSRYGPPKGYSSPQKGKKLKSAGPLRRWTNPHTGHSVEGRRASSTTIRDWIKKHGQEEVDSWAVYLDEGEQKTEH